MENLFTDELLYALDYRGGSSGNIARRIYNVYTPIGKRIWPVISTAVLKLKDYSRSQAIQQSRAG